MNIFDRLDKMTLNEARGVYDLPPAEMIKALQGVKGVYNILAVHKSAAKKAGNTQKFNNIAAVQKHFKGIGAPKQEELTPERKEQIETKVKKGIEFDNPAPIDKHSPEGIIHHLSAKLGPKAAYKHLQNYLTGNLDHLKPEEKISVQKAHDLMKTKFDNIESNLKDNDDPKTIKQLMSQKPTDMIAPKNDLPFVKTAPKSNDEIGKELGITRMGVHKTLDKGLKSTLKKLMKLNPDMTKKEAAEAMGQFFGISNQHDAKKFASLAESMDLDADDNE